VGIFSKSKVSNDLALVFDIGSSSVGGAFFVMEKNGAPKILFSVREQIPIEEELTPDKLFHATIAALKIVASTICMKGLGNPSKIHCVLSSPWYASQTRVIRLEKDTPFIFTEKLADSLIQKEIVVYEEEYVSKEHKDKIRAIELKNMSVTLNGYPTRTPENQKARELEMTIFISMSEENFLAKVEDTIMTHFNKRDIKFSSFAMAAFTVARDMFVNKESFLLVNIGAEITDISMIKKDTLKESISFPHGRNFIIRGLANALTIPLPLAKSYLSLYKDGHMSDANLAIIEPMLTKIKDEWLTKFEEAISNLTNDISIPSTVFITVDHELVDFFSNIIKTEEFNQYALTESKFRVVFLGVQALHGIAIFDTNVTRDPFLIIESIYINNFLQQYHA
jgi:cell division ATPase FtsA